MKLLPKILFLASLCCVLITVSIFLFMVALGLPLFEEGLFFSGLVRMWDPHSGLYGIFPMIIGTLLIASSGVAIAFPVSLGCASLVSGIAGNKVSAVLKRTVELMTGIPTVVYGFVGVFLLVPFIREFFESGSGMCILSASMMLALLISPTMIIVFTESFDQLPFETRLAVDAMGGTPTQKFLYLILPSSVSGIANGLVLALGRAAGDTMISLMIAGNSVAIPGTVLDSARSLTSHIALVIAADFQSLEFKTLFACGIVLYLFSATLVMIIRLISSNGKRKL
jgi:phosphate transport system permease protein